MPPMIANQQVYTVLEESMRGRYFVMDAPELGLSPTLLQILLPNR